MSAGLPGAGLAGVFFVLSALLAVPLEAVRTVRGRSSRAAWMQVTRNAALALAMIAALQLFFMGISAIVRHLAAHGKSPLPKTLPIAPVLMALAVLVIVLLTAKGLELALRWRAALRARRGRALLSTHVPSSAD
jgi:protein-S-isoprenylcysteine O-methyltransferase Ste14